MSTETYKATVTISGGGLDIVPGQEPVSDSIEVSFSSWMKGDPGPNQVNNTTDSNITGLLKGASGKVAQAVAGTDYVAPENGKGLSSNDYTTAEKTKLAGLSNYDDTEVRGDISSIEAVIPDTATASNKLADQAFVNSSIATNAATFRGNVTAADDTETAAQTALATIAIKDNNDYANVVVPGTPNAGLDKYKRYTFNGTVWSFNYAINTSGFTATQWAAINSGATAEVIAAIAGKYVKPAGGIPSSDMSEAVQTSLGKADAAVSFVTQELTEAQKAQARANIGAQELDIEQVTVTLTCEDEGVSTSGVTVTKNEDGVDTAYTSDANGQVGFTVKRGHMYTLRYGSLGMYAPPVSATYTASMPVRTITSLYRGMSALCWGIKLDQSMSQICRGYTGDRSLWTAWQDKIGRYLLKPDGTALKLKSDDSTKLTDGTTVDETQGDIMVRIPQFYYKVVGNGDGTCTLWGSETAISGFYAMPEQWIGAYLGATVNGRLRSRSGISPTHSKNISAFHSEAKAIADGYGLTDYKARQTMLMIFLWKYGTANSQDPDCLGYGMTGSGSNWTEEVLAELTGRTAALGDACGGVAFSATGTLASHVSLYGIEDPFGWFWEMIQGVYFGSSANAPAQDGTEIFIYDGNRMPSAAELMSEPDGNFRKLTRLTTSGYPKILPLVDRFDLFASQYGGGSASNWYDYCYASATGQLLLVGGSANNGSACGLVYAASLHGWSYSTSFIGARLAFYGNVTIED